MFVMIFALSILFVLVTLYFLVFDVVPSNIKRITFEDSKIIEKTSAINEQNTTFFEFDFETLVTPNEPSIIIVKKKTT